MNGKISVVVPVYNTKKYLGRCLDSLMAQTYKNLEILCVNDGSTDNSQKILEDYAAKDSRITIIVQENGGLSAARNTGIAHATGTFVSFVDSDDELVSCAYEKIMECFSDDVDVVWFEPRIIYEDYAIYQHIGRSDANYYNLKYSGRTYITDKVLLDSDVNAWNKVIRLSKIKETGVLFPKGMLYEDSVFYWNFFSLVKNVFFLKEKLYIYYRHSQSIMADTFAKKAGKAIYHIYLLDFIYNFWKEHNLLQNRKDTLQKICASYFSNAMRNVADFEKALVVWEMCRRLREWNIGHDTEPILECIRDGKYDIAFWKVNNWSPSEKPLKPLERIFCVRKEHGKKVVRLFTKKLFAK